MFGRETRMLLRHYLEQGTSKSALARELGVSRDTIHRWVRDGDLDRDLDDEAVRYGPRPTVPTKLDAYKPIIEARLAAYPELSFSGTVDQISPIGVQSSLSPKVRNFIVLISVHGAHPNLMPDLSASLDVELARSAGALVVPRDAVGYDGRQAYVRVQRGSAYERRDIAVGTQNTHEIVVESGLPEGSVIARNVAQGVIR